VASKQLKWIIPSVLLVLTLLAALAWWMIGSLMTQQGEVKLQETLSGFELDKQVKWDDFSVSPLGTATLKNVRFELSPEYLFNIEQVHISDVINQPEHQRIRVQLKQIKEPFSLTGLNTLPAAFLNPMDINLQLDLNFANNQAELTYDSQQKAVVDFALKLNLSEIGALRGLLGAIFPQSAAASMELDPNFTGLNRLAAMYSISLNSLEARINNYGLVEQLTSEFKQHMENIPNNPASGSIEQAREEAFLKVVQDIQGACHNGVQSLKQSCQTLADFILGKQNSVQLTAKPAQPVSLKQFDNAMNAGEAASIVQLLGIQIK